MSADQTRQIVLWVAGGAGIVLLYSAFKGESPVGILGSFASSNDTIGTSTGTAEPRTTLTPGTGDTQATYTAYVAPTAATAPTTAVDANGYTTDDVPAAYATSPGTYQPSPDMT